jgi:hypothetical protein
MGRMVHIKGTSFMTKIKYIHEHDPGGVWDKIVNELEPEFAQQVRNSLLNHQWYEDRYFVRLCCLMDKYLGRGDKALIWESGRLSAHETSILYKAFFRIGSAEFILKMAPVFFKQLVDSGILRAQNETDPESKINKYRLIIEGCQTQYPDLWLSIAGFIQGAMEVTKVRDIKVEICKQGVVPHSSCEIMVSYNR